ncbi:hypothetical protein ACFFX1_26650 [Dactylosporangium sucinum]|uniref:hypothetical protein n=1 Tax=Dactylosporangium sucinum TaxID=1424081 RepID=UPI00167D01FE|nr:hypothetical protein [Dactylosporangium sucinum]
MSDEARQYPGPGQHPQGVSPPSPWAVPPTQRPEPEEPEWEQQTEAVSPNWLPAPGEPAPPATSTPGATPYGQQPPSQQPQYGPPQQHGQPQYGPPQQHGQPQYGPPPQQYGQGYGQASVPPYGQTSAPPYPQPGFPPVSGPPGAAGQTSGGPYWTGGGPAVTPPGVSPAGQYPQQQQPGPMPPQPAPGSWTAGQAPAAHQQPPGQWPQGYAAAPVSVPPQPVSVPPQPVSVPPLPVSVPPQPAGDSWPSAQPAQSRPGWTAAAPEEPAADLDEPSGGRTVLWSIVVAVVVAVLAGGGGYFLGASGTFGGKKADPQAGGSPAGSSPPSSSGYEQSLEQQNKPKFDGDLAPLAAPWLTQLSGCRTDTEPRGPKLADDESRHVHCRYFGLSVQFAQYPSAEARDAARAYRVKLYTNSGDSLAPGLVEPGPKTSGRGAQGEYVEYALKYKEDRVLCGIWWNRNDGNAGMYMEGECVDGASADWKPLRELWQRNS